MKGQGQRFHFWVERKLSMVYHTYIMSVGGTFIPELVGILVALCSSFITILGWTYQTAGSLHKFLLQTYLTLHKISTDAAHVHPLGHPPQKLTSVIANIVNEEYEHMLYNILNLRMKLSWARNCFYNLGPDHLWEIYLSEVFFCS